MKELVFMSLVLIGCSQQPTKLSDKTETIEVYYVNWACSCPDFIETRFSKNDSDYRAKEEDCIYIEPSNSSLIIPEEYYNKGHFENYLKLTGKFYVDKGVPETYDPKTPERPEKARVFRYDSFKLIKIK